MPFSIHKTMTGQEQIGQDFGGRLQISDRLLRFWSPPFEIWSDQSPLAICALVTGVLPCVSHTSWCNILQGLAINPSSTSLAAIQCRHIPYLAGCTRHFETPWLISKYWFSAPSRSVLQPSREIFQKGRCSFWITFWMFTHKPVGAPLHAFCWRFCKFPIFG